MKLINSVCTKLFSFFNNCFSKDQDDDLSDSLIQMKEVKRTYFSKQFSPRKDNSQKFKIDQFSDNQNIVQNHGQEALTVSVTKIVYKTNTKFRTTPSRATQAIFTFGQSQTTNEQKSQKGPKRNSSKQSLRSAQHKKTMKLTFNIQIYIFNNPDYAALMSSWSQHAYSFVQLPNDYSYLNHAMKFKVGKHIFLGIAIKKIEGYETLESIKQQPQERANSTTQNSQNFNQFIGVKFGQYENSSIGLKCNYKRKGKKKGQKGKDYDFLKMVTFQTNTSHVLSILKWYNNHHTWEALYNITSINLIENQNQKYCVFQAEQFTDKMVKKHTYTILRQIYYVKLSHQPNKQFIVQIDITIGRDKTFRSYMRFQIGEKGKVQILSESSEKADGKNHLLYHDQWKQFQQILKKHKIVKNNQVSCQNGITQKDQESS